MTTVSFTELQSQPQELSLSLIAAEFDELLHGSSAHGGDDAGALPTGASNPNAASMNGPGQPPAQPTKDGQALLDGNWFNQNPQSSKPPPLQNESASQLAEADGGLLDDMGNQHLKGEGAKGMTGGIKDELAKDAGGHSAADIGTNKAVTEKALMIAEADKNQPDSNGKLPPASVRHNGNMSGLTKGNEVMKGSDLANLQDQSKNPSFKISPERAADIGMNGGNDTEKTGAHKIWNKEEKWILPLIMAPLDEIPGVAEAEGGALVGEAAEAGANAAKAGAAARAAGKAGSAAGKAGSSGGAATASDIMSQAAKQSAQAMAKEGLKQGRDEAWNQVQNQLPQGQSPDQSDQPSVTFSIPRASSIEGLL